MLDLDSPRARSFALTVGGAAFAAGNLLHPLEHSPSAERSSTWVLAHVVFSAGALLLAAGLPALRARLGTALGAVATAVWWVGLVLIVPGGFFEAFVTPELGADVQARVEDAAAPVLGLAGLCYLGGAVLVGVASWRSRALPRPAAGALIAAAVVLVLLPALPGADGWYVIAGSVTTGLVMVVAGLLCAQVRPAADPVRRPVPA